jgi:prolyl 3-hydroxylase /prolyl 3,4-dihydroxylase
MKKHTEPFPHWSIENFLTPQQYKQLAEVYSHLQFIEKESDLFHFYQTHELAEESSLNFFKKALNEPFQQLTSMKDTHYNIFASHYFKNNYLLCHDDVVDDRKYAFSYYLEDHPSGELVLYDSTATNIVKKIKVKKNLLVIFEVSNVSYHEVALTKTDGRKAVTGWLNQKGHGTTRAKKVIPPYQVNLPKDLVRFEFPEEIEEEEYYCFPGVDYQFDIVKETRAGPSYERKAWRLELAQDIVMDLKGYSLMSVDYFKFAKNDYMLLNDPVNSLEGDILDVFVMKLPKGRDGGDFITVVKENGEVDGHIPYSDETMFIVHRGKKNYYIDLVQKEINLAHFIYRKDQPKPKKNMLGKATKAPKAPKAKKAKAKVAAQPAKKASAVKSKPIAKGQLRGGKGKSVGRR